MKQGLRHETERLERSSPAMSRHSLPRTRWEGVPELVEDALREQGEPLPEASRSTMETRFKHDFSKVKVHTGQQADAAARSLGALAFTSGEHIFFRAGAFAPETPTGSRTLAHELVHVIQQQHASQDSTRPLVGREGDAHEREAVALSNTGVHLAQPFAPALPSVPLVQRMPAAAAAAAGAAVTEPIEVAAALASVAALAGQVYSGGSGSLRYTSGTADRHSEHPQPKGRDYSAVCLRLRWLPLVSPDINVYFTVHWQGNDFGEIGAARVRVNIEKSSELTLSDLNVRFEPLRNLIQPDGDRRTWQMMWDYEGEFNPVGMGKFWFQGSFAIDAFGNYLSLEHKVRDLSLGPESFVWVISPGMPIYFGIPPLPASTTGEEVANKK